MWALRPAVVSKQRAAHLPHLARFIAGQPNIVVQTWKGRAVWSRQPRQSARRRGRADDRGAGPIVVCRGIVKVPV